MSPVISLISTVYNRAHYLGNAIESVLAQTYGDFELLIWDDGSTDDSLKIAQRYACLDSRVRVFAAPHQGRSASLQAVHAEAMGEYLGWIDSDDSLAPTALEETVAVLSADPRVGLVYTDYQVIDAKGRLKGDGLRCGIPYSKERLLLDFMTFHFRLIRRTAFEAAGGIDVSIPVAVDYDLCLRLSEVTEVQHLPRSLYRYRVHLDSISQAQQLQQMHWSKESILRALVRRGLGAEWVVDLQVVTTARGDLQGQFSLQRKGVALQQKPVSTLSPWVRRVGQALTLLNLSLAVSSSPVWAVPIVPNADGIRTKVNVNGNQFDITGGMRSGDGRNLFHSFKDFNLDAAQIANFVSDPNIQNILGRINGGNASMIDGLLKVSGGNSNLFLLNPSGIIFGNNATLNVPAAFTATTANGIQFGNGWFSATGANDYEALSGAPIGFAFSGSQPGAIVNAGNLAVGSGQNLTLMGGTVASPGQLSAPDGQVTVSVVPGSSYVRLSQAGQLLSLEVKLLSSSTTQPNASNVPITSLPELLTGPGAASATGLTVADDGTVQLTGTDVAVAPGDVTVKSLNAGTANLSAANTLSLVESQITTAKDLTLAAQNTVMVRDSVENPVVVKAGGDLSVTGNQGIDITTINAFTTTALQSGGNLNLSSDGLIHVDASLSSGSDLSFLNLTGGTGNLVNGNQTSLESKGVVNLGNYTGVSLKVEANGSIRAGDITITGPKTQDVSGIDPDYDTLTRYPALILRAGLTESASILSVGNVIAHGGVVNFSTNGNIFTGNIDVSSSEVGTRGGTIKLNAFNIFTGHLKASSTSFHKGGFDVYFGAGYGADSIDNAGTVSLNASSYLRTGNVDTHSVSGDGGAVTITAADAIVGSIDTSGSTNPIRRNWQGGEKSYDFKGGDVSVKTDEPLQHGAIATDGVKKGTVSIEQREISPDFSNGIDFDDSEISSTEIEDINQVRENTLQFMTAQLLAGQKKTAQEIAAQLYIPLEIAQIAVLNPIGDNIQVPVPDLSELNDDILFAGGKPGLVPAVLKILQKFFPKLFTSTKSGKQPLKKFIFNAKLPLYVKDIIKKPNAYWGKSAEEISQAFQDAGFKTIVRQAPRGSQRAKLIDIEGHPQIQQIEVHPGGGLHKGAYLRFSTNSNGRIKIIDPKTYKSAKDPERNVTFLYVR